MTAEDIKAYCLSKHKACEAYPFGKVPVCYKLNDKIFAQLYPDEGNYKITLKCTADAAQFYRMVYPDKIVEGYHCSKVQKPYWNTIYLDDFPEKELYNMIDFAYDTVLHGFSKSTETDIGRGREIVTASDSSDRTETQYAYGGCHSTFLQPFR